MPATPIARASHPFPGAMRAIHWATALLMVAVVVLAWIIPRGPGNGGILLLLHESVGLSILALAALRVIVRNASRLPPEDGGLQWIETATSRAVHILLYVILFVMPLSGYLSSAARGHSVSVFGLFDIPPLVPVSKALRTVAWAVHENGQVAVYAVVGLHVAAALFHLLVRRDGVMARMWPGASRFTLTARSASAHPAAE